MVNSPVFGIDNSKAATSSSPTSISTAPLAPVAPTILPGATPYNSSLDWIEGTGGVRGCYTATTGCASNYSPETQITAANIGQLQVSYIFPLPSTLSSPTAFATRLVGVTYSSSLDGTQVATLSSNGIGYTLSNYLNIYGFNLATGAAAGASLALNQPTACTPATGQSLGQLIAADSKGLAPTAPTPCIGSLGEMDLADDYAAWLKMPMSSGVTHDHSWNMVPVSGVGDVAWIGGYGCSIQGWAVATGTLVANLTGMCGSAAQPVPGTLSPIAGSGKMVGNGNGPVQVVPWDNEIIYWASGSSEGSGGFRAFTFACSLSLALSQYTPGTGSQCAPNYSNGNGGACNTDAGGVCSSGSSMLWRTFTMPAYDGSTPNFAVPYCSHTPNIIWIAGVPCSAIMQVNANIIAVDGQRPDLAAQNGGDAVFPSTGCSQVWGNLAVDPKDNIIAEGTGDTGPDWNDTLRMGFSIFCNSLTAFNLTNGTILWSDKSFTKDINDQDCNLNAVFTQLGPAGSANNPTSFVTGGGSTTESGQSATGFGSTSVTSTTPINDVPMNIPLPTGGMMPNGGGVFVKQCKSGVSFAVNALTGQPLWMFDPSMPDYTTINSATTSAMSRPFLCSPTNATACDVGRVWDEIAHRVSENQTYPDTWAGLPGGPPACSTCIKMQGTNPHPHGFLNGGLTRGSPNLDPLNNTEVGTCTGLGTSTVSCNPGFTCPTGAHAACVAIDTQGVGGGYFEERYIGETETSIDPSTGIWVTAAMTGPSEHDWIGDVNKQGQSGNVSGISLYFAGIQPTNSTLYAIQISTGQLLWYYQRPIYYRGSVLTFGGMVMAGYPDGHLDFFNEQTGALLRDINVGIPLLAPNSIAPDSNGVMHILVSYGGANHGNLGNPSIHGALGRGYVTTGGIISYVLGPAPVSSAASTSTTTVSSTVTSIVTSGGVTSTVSSVVTSVSTVSGATSTVISTIASTTGVSSLAFYGAVGVAAILAIVAGALVVLRRRPSA